MLQWLVTVKEGCRRCTEKPNKHCLIIDKVIYSVTVSIGEE